MVYVKALPRMDKIQRLNDLVTSYPTTTGDVLKTARHWSFSNSTIDFLQLFPRDEVFESSADFLARCEELELMIREERHMPVEIPRNPLD